MPLKSPQQTSGLSLEEVDELYASVSPRKSVAYNAMLKAQRNDFEQAREHGSDAMESADDVKMKM